MTRAQDSSVSPRSRVSKNGYSQFPCESPPSCKSPRSSDRTVTNPAGREGVLLSSHLRLSDSTLSPPAAQTVVWLSPVPNGQLSCLPPAPPSPQGPGTCLVLPAPPHPQTKLSLALARSRADSVSAATRPRRWPGPTQPFCHLPRPQPSFHASLSHQPPPASFLLTCRLSNNLETPLSILSNPAFLQASSPLLSSIKPARTHYPTPEPFSGYLRTTSPPAACGLGCSSIANVILCHCPKLSRRRPFPVPTAGLGSQPVLSTKESVLGVESQAADWHGLTLPSVGTREPLSTLSC